MKKILFLFSATLIVFGLTAFGYANWNQAETDQKKSSTAHTVSFDNGPVYSVIKEADFDFIYNIDSRFIHNISKEDLHNAKSILDILPEKVSESIESCQGIQVSILHDDREIYEDGEGAWLNPAQIKLVQSTDYSTDILVSADYKRKNTRMNELAINHLTYYITVIPEQEAEYAGGQDELINYLKANSLVEAAIVTRDKLQPGRVSFQVTKEGKIAKVNLDASSAYPSLDKVMLELIANMPEKWNPATNSKGVKVDQELIFFFGLQGC